MCNFSIAFKNITMADSSKDHQLTLKVMRLTKPSFAEQLVLPVESHDLCGLELRRNDGIYSLATDALALPEPFSDTLMLPQSFENIYLGETFSCYICVHNDSNLVATDVCLKVDLQTSSQRVNLPNRYQEPQSVIEPDQTFGEIITHEVKEIGQHILVCAVSYTSHNGEKMYFRKFFKFPVAKPLDVKTKFYNAESDDVYLEAQIQNTSHLPMFIERVSLEPSELYTALELGSGVFAGFSHLHPNDVRQYLYCLKPRFKLGSKVSKGVTSIGKLDMVWRTTMGERGRLQTSQLQRMVPGYGDIRLTVEESPSTVKMHQPFQLGLLVHNCSERTLDLFLVLDGSVNPALIWLCKSNTNVGKLEANSTLPLTLQLVAVAAGLQTISGIRLTDTFLNRTYEHDEVAQTFVYT